MKREEQKEKQKEVTTEMFIAKLIGGRPMDYKVV